MGRIAQPAKLKILKGRGDGKDTAGRPVNPPPKFNRGAPDAPDEFDNESRAEWDRIVPGLDALDLLKSEDYAALVEHCQTWSTYITAIREVRASGITVFDPKMQRVIKNPALLVAEKAGSELRASCREFGLTPSSEQNLARPAVGDDNTEDPYSTASA